ncbi:MAG: AlpA family phage regulatory protein [Pseudomonadota bacterium]
MQTSDTTPAVIPLNGEAWLSPKQFAAALGLSVSTLYNRLRDDPAMPKPTKVGPRLTRWRASAIRQYMATVERRSPAEAA